VSVTLRPAPVSAVGNRYYVGIWGDRPRPATLSVLPAAIGFACYSPLVADAEYVPPLHVANTPRPADPRLDPPGETATGASLPGVVLDVPGGFPPGTKLTFQGVVGDGNPRANRSVSLTNAVVVSVL